MTNKKDKIYFARHFCREVMDYFDGLPCLNDDEQSMRDGAEWTLDKLNDKED